MYYCKNYGIKAFLDIQAWPPAFQSGDPLCPYIKADNSVEIKERLTEKCIKNFRFRVLHMPDFFNSVSKSWVICIWSGSFIVSIRKSFKNVSALGLSFPQSQSLPMLSNSVSRGDSLSWLPSTKTQNMWSFLTYSIVTLLGNISSLHFHKVFNGSWTTNWGYKLWRPTIYLTNKSL